MIINLSPVFFTGLTDYVPLMLAVQGDTLYVNEEEFDFSPLPFGYTLPSEAVDSDWFVGPITKDDAGRLTVTLRFPHPMDADESMRFPVPIFVTENGPVDLPVYVPPTVEEFPPLEVIENEDRLLVGYESTDSDGSGSPEQEHRGDPVPTIDGLDGDSSTGDPEADPSVSTDETSESSGTSDRGVE